ncbi:hybrid sensor histidine kinase/response regulator [Pseudoduganella violaceinigra]|uniref:hybrid sensor histidine kinase/response regulator n=1 Tax=Pseudoduganella violaceinigra TaxID=246602 RepID=UPI000552A272|nr:PAS domain-containing sensor histidine kinase [Pseudoduganella violaceinigra]
MIKDPPAIESLSTRYELLVASISDYAIYMLDTEGRISSWNAGAQRFNGFSETEVLGSHFSRFHTQEDQRAGVAQRALATALREGRFECESYCLRKDGSHFWASVVIDPIHTPEGEHVGFANVTRDITERKRVMEALRESEQRFRLLVQGVIDYAIYMLSPQGLITNWNLGAERIKGYTLDEVVGTHYRRFFTEEDKAAGVPERALEVAAREGRYESEGWRVRKDGTRFWAHAVVDALYDDDGELLGFAKVTRDNTEQRQAQQSLEQARAALFQAQKMESIGQLTGGVAHDFNNLLAVVSNGIDILRTAPPEATGLRVLDSMRRAVDRGAALTQQLLSFARQQPLAPSVQQLNRLVTGFEGVLRRAAGPLVNFELNLDRRLRQASIDEARFEAALLNLVVNARDAMPEGGTLEITTRNVTLAANQAGALPAGDYVRVSVTDNGSGMSDEVRERAFEPFYTTKEVGKGTGLGLSQVYGFFVQSGGGVTIDTEAGKGSTINLYLPALAESLPEASRPRGVREERVLIVDDDPLVMESARELFQSMGYATVHANDAASALRALQRDGDVDVLFSDVMMPNGMTGLELAREVRQRYPGIKIILASGLPQPVEGFSFVGKPYSLADVARQLRVA